MENLDAEIIAWLEFAKGGPGSGAQSGHPFEGNQFTSGAKNWGDKQNTKSALSGITAKDYASSWNQVPMTDTAAKIMEAESRHPDTEKAIQGKPEMTNDERSADAIPKWLVQSATPKDLEALTDNNFHSSVRYIESQRPDLVQKSAEMQKDFFGHVFHGNQHTGGEGAGAVPGRFAVSPDRFQPLASRAQELAKTPTPQGHRDLASQHTEQANALREMAKTAKPEQANALEHAANSHDIAALAHLNTASTHENPITSGEYAQSSGERAATKSQMADDRTANALSA